MAGPFHGVRIIDISTVLMGPLATQLFGDLGADVIKVETKEGDVVRQIGPGSHPDMGFMYLTLNRNKRSIVLDLKSAQGKAAVLKLAASADVLFYNLRPQTMARLGLSYEEVRAVNPQIIYCGAYGFSQKGPYADKPAYDDLIQGSVGIPHLSEQMTGTPSYAPFALADHLCGLYAAFCLSAALFHRKVTGEGQSVEVPMFETMAQALLTHHQGGKSFVPPLGEVGYARQLSPKRRPFSTKDGHICMILLTDAQWQRFFGAVGRPEVMEDKRFWGINNRTANTSALYEIVEACLIVHTSAHWIELFGELDIPAMPMQTLDQLLQDPHLLATGFFQKIEHPTEGSLTSMSVASHWSASVPEERRKPAPRLGEDTVNVLLEAGYTASEIQNLINLGIARTRNDPS